jgi:hypothetical protein
MKYVQVVSGVVAAMSPVATADCTIQCDDAVKLGWLYDGSKFTEVDLAPTDPLQDPKTARIALARQEASDRILAAYPQYAQSNAALGVYSGLPITDPFYPANMVAGIQAIRAAFAAAVTAINALTDAVAIGAFTW